MIDVHEAYTDSSKLWSLVTTVPPTKAVKRSVLWIGNLCDDVTDDKLTDYIVSRAEEVGLDSLTIFNMKIFTKPEKKGGARITINAAAKSMLLTRSFWPRPVYARPFKFRDDEKSDMSHQPQEQLHQTKDTEQEQQRQHQVQNQPQHHKPTISLPGDSERTTELLNEVRQATQPPDANNDDLQLTLSPESTWGDAYMEGDSEDAAPSAVDECGEVHNKQPQDAATVELESSAEAVLALTPASRGKSRGHVTQSPPELPGAKKTVHRPDNVSATES